MTRWFRWSLSVADPFVCRCLTSSAMLPFPHPAHRTGRADLPHPVLGEDSRNPLQLESSHGATAQICGQLRMRKALRFHNGASAEQYAKRGCLFAFRCSARHRKQRKTPQAPRTPLIFGSAPSVLDRWWSSRDSRLPKCNFVLHRWSPLPHETTLSINKILRASPRPVVVRLITEQICSFGFRSGSLCDIFSKKTLSGRAV